VQPHERIQDREDGLFEAVAIGGQIESQGRCGNGVNVEVTQADAGGSTDAFQATAHDVQRVCRFSFNMAIFNIQRGTLRGYQLTPRAHVFGGDTLTTSAIAVAAGYANFGNRERAAQLSASTLQSAVDRIHQILAGGVPRIISADAHAANHPEATLVQLTFDFYMIEAKPQNLIGDKASSMSRCAIRALT
jgi:hypothetical protein